MLQPGKTNLVLLPGLITDARLFRYQVTDLADITKPMVADLTTADTIAEMAASVLAESPAEFALAGLSMGGYVALEIMRQAPERVLGLCLMDTSARPDTPESAANREKLMALAETNFQVVLDTLMPKLLHPSRMRYNSMVDSVYAMGHRVGKDVFIRQQRAILGRIDSRPTLPAISVPTLVMCGREDLITPVELHEEMAAAIPEATLAVIGKCGHLVTMGQPKLSAGAMRVWLEKLRPE
jgi:pimeloyl-ACP methyl ester carboxylesterase